MRKKHIHQHKIEVHSPEWHAFRMENGIGASEISSVIATVSETVASITYTPAIKWHLAKIGEPVQEFTGNVASESGHFFEPIILHWYKYLDIAAPNQLEMFQNIRANNRINKVVSPKVFITNDKYPGFFCSPDAWGWRKMTYKTYLECKNTTSMTARLYANKVDPAFWLQVQQGLMITEMDEADLCILVDGRWFEVVTIKPDPNVHELIRNVGSKMWANVLQARMIKLKYGIVSYFGINPDFLTPEQREGAALLSELEPKITGTEDELSFIKEMVKPQAVEIEMQGTDEQYELAKAYLYANRKIKNINTEKDGAAAKLILSLGGYTNAVFEDKSFFSYKEDARGAKRLYVQDKIIKQDDL